MASNNNQPNANGGFETVSGLTPDERRLPFKVSTSDVEKYLKKRLHILQKKAQDDDEIEITVYSSESSRQFVPFVVLLSMNASENAADKKNQKGDAFFTTDRSGGSSVHLKQYVYNFFEDYKFDKGDAIAFQSDNWRRMMGVSRETSTTLKSLTDPKIMKDRNGRVLGIYFLLDPVRVFFDMLRSPNSNKAYRISIESFNKQDATSFVYNVVRELDNKKKKGYGKSIVDEINYKMRSGNR